MLIIKSDYKTVLFITFFICFAGGCLAQDSLHIEVELPELTELTYDETELLNWQLITLAKEIAFRKPNIRIGARHNLLPGKEILTNRLIFSATGGIGSSFPQLNGIFYQKLEPSKRPVNLGQFGLMGRCEKYVKMFALGSFRLQAGEGLCLGAYNTSGSRQNDVIHPASGLSHPALTGFAAQLNFRKIDVTGWLSQTSRIVSRQDDTILRFYESRLVTTETKEKTPEKTAGMIVSYYRQDYHLGALYYNQSYDYHLSDALGKPVKDAAGVFGIYKNKPFSLSGELNLANDKLAQAFNYRQQSTAFTQNLRYHYRPAMQKLPYSKTRQIFGQAAGNQEISWDLSYKPLNRLTLTARIAAFRVLTLNTDTSWKERLIWSANWREKDWHSSLTWYRFRKTAMPDYDTLYTELLPTQNRIRANWAKNITPQLQYGVICQYQHYLDRKVTRNGFSMQQSVKVNTKKLDWGVTYLAWTNQKSVYQPTELLTYDELLIQADSDTAFRAYFRYDFSKYLNLSLSAYRPNRRVSRQSYWLSVQTNL